MSLLPHPQRRQRPKPTLAGMGKSVLEPLETRNLWGDIDIERIAPPTWTATAEARRSRHRTTGFCPTKLAPYGPKDPFGELVGDACRVTGCFDIYHDLLTGVVTKVLRHTESHPHQPIANLAGFVSSVARSELTELQRAERTRRGRPAKPTRNDGVGGRINSVLKRDPVIGEWLEVLFRIMRAYPFSPHHVCGTWPIQGLVEERARYLPGSDGTVVRREIDLVMATATAEAGREWTFDNLTGPLMTEGDHSELSPDAPDCRTVHLTDRAMASQLKDVYWSSRGRGLSPRAALVEASRVVCGKVPDMSSAVESILAELEANPPSRLR